MEASLITSWTRLHVLHILSPSLEKLQWTVFFENLYGVLCKQKTVLSSLLHNNWALSWLTKQKTVAVSPFSQKLIWIAISAVNKSDV